MEVETILSSGSYTEVIWGGDLNWDMSRETYIAKTLSAFVARFGLVSLWSKYPVTYTYLHNDNKSVSVIDHFLISPRLPNLVATCVLTLQLCRGQKIGQTMRRGWMKIYCVYG